MTIRGPVRRGRLAPPRYAVLLGWGLPLLSMLAAWLIGLATGRPISELTRDPVAVLLVPPYLGLLSNIGVVLWAAAAALALFSAARLWSVGRRDGVTSFLAVLGLLSGVLLVDDLFMLHEWIFPMVLGLPQWLPLAVEAVLLMVLLGGFRSVYLGMNLFFLGSALIGFGGSVLIDFVPDHVLPGHYLLEDGFKLIGIANWLAFTVQIVSRQLVARAA